MSEWTTALPDWERRIVAGESLIPCDPIFPDQAEEGLSIFRQLVAVDVAGKPTFGEISRKWILDLVAAIFGAYDADTGKRLIREVFLLISKKNGKSTDLAGIILTALLLNWRESGEMGILAPTIEVANNAWKPARDAIRADEELSDLLQVQDHIRTITHRGTNATLQVVAADSDTVAGKKWIVTLVDELWLFGKKPNADKMLLEATGGMASRPEGFVMYCTTQSDDPPAGVFKSKLQYARDVRDGIIRDPEFLPVLYEFPKDIVKSKGYLDESNWYITNPNLGASVDPAFIRRKIREAEHEPGTGSLQSVLAKHLDVEIGTALRSDRWKGADYWDLTTRREITLKYLLEVSEVIDVGIDGGGLDDLLALALLGRHAETKEWLAWCRAWAHPTVMELRKDIVPRLHDFEKQGDLVIVRQMGDDIDELSQIVAGVEEAGLLDRVGADPAGVGAILDSLEAKQVPAEKLVSVSQGWKMSGTIKTAERRLAEGTFWHADQSMMQWCVGNAKTIQVGNATNITKQVSGSAKIDPLMALFDAVTLMALNPPAMHKKYQLMVF
ncbi:terminase large subunit [Candidimonas humi]|uniref:Terminase large subunit n=1 Tax=Candidimonas humi TaxID=683355 RepID=A0ABV8NYS0_9BURK|nr:terminase TerL endonuclease subunit [Candidimonas humi]MBV6304927.1 terminase large subunit [Candidimonas humi]